MSVRKHFSEGIGWSWGKTKKPLKINSSTEQRKSVFYRFAGLLKGLRERDKT